MGRVNTTGKQFKSKLSRSYRFKKKTGKVQNRTDDAEKNDFKKPRIVIRNLPFKATETDVRRLYEPFGEIDEVNLLKRPDGKLVGCGFVQFKNLQDASKAIFKTNKSDFLGRTISTEWAIPKSQFYQSIRKEEEEAEVKAEVAGETEESINEYADEQNETSESVQVLEQNDSKPDKRKGKKNGLSRAEQRKLYKEKKRQKRARIIVRNLPFTLSDEALKERFSKYGNIEELKIPQKQNGRRFGYCFIQYERVQSAAQAIHYENLKTILNRKIVVDWAIAKDKYEQANTTAVKTSSEANDTVEIKEEMDETLNDSETKVKEEKLSDEEDVKSEQDSDEEGVKDEQDSVQEQSDEGSDNDVNSEDEDDDEDEQNEDDDEDDQNEYDDEDDQNEDDKLNIKMEMDNESTDSRHPRRISNDVNEGKTVFIKNVPFTAKNEDLKECMEQFGPVYYALICIDPLTEHSKGSAFVKFRNVEDAEKCLAAGTELKLHDQILDPHRALHRNEVNEKNKEKKKKDKDTRNLYLVKEGVILANSPAAQEVSAADMARRLQLEQWKSQMLRNLNMFVSRVRLVIQNLPPTVDDSKLRQLFKKHSNASAVITEARVMRDLRNVDANGIGNSKEYGFVSFTNHEDALKALRSINNNPNIFTRAKRPIVAFSIENRVMVNAKQKRLERSRQHNPTFKDLKRQAPAGDGNAKQDENEVDKKRQKKGRKAGNTTGEAGSDEVESFAGVTGKPGVNRMNGKFFLKKQAAMHSQNLKQQKKKTKELKRLTEKKRSEAASRKEAKPKQGSRKEDADEANFNRLVNSYKNKLSTVSSMKSKWYET